MAESDTRTCPMCKEEIKAEAIKCKHCHSAVQPDRPDHEGICPFCKEEVKPEAIKCKHCKSRIDGGAEPLGGCGCQETAQSSLADDWLDATTPTLRAARAAPGGGLNNKHDCYTDCKDANDCANSNAPIACKTQCFDRCYPSVGFGNVAIGADELDLANSSYMMSSPTESLGQRANGLPPIYETNCRDVWLWVCTGTPRNYTCRWKKIGRICKSRPIPTFSDSFAMDVQ